MRSPTKRTATVPDGTAASGPPPPWGWLHIDAAPAEMVPHVVPSWDLHCHVVSPFEVCRCNPVDEGDIIRHNAFDGRERYEDGLAHPH